MKPIDFITSHFKIEQTPFVEIASAEGICLL